MKRPLLAGGLAIAVLALAACGGGGESNGTASPSAGGPSASAAPSSSGTAAATGAPSSVASPAPTGGQPSSGTPAATGCASSPGTVNPGLDTEVRLDDGRSQFAGGEPVPLTLRVLNCGAAAVHLVYPTSQRYDFSVKDAQGQEVWRWSDGRIFAQVLGDETIPPGGVLTYSETWDQRGRDGQQVSPGRYQVLAVSVGCGQQGLSGCQFGRAALLEITP